MGHMSEIDADLKEMAEIDRQTHYYKHLVRRKSLPSERLAAAKLTAKRLTKIQAAVMEFINQCPAGATDLDLEQFFQNQRSTYRTRRAELVAMGKLRNSGRTRLQGGSRRVIWEAA